MVAPTSVIYQLAALGGTFDHFHAGHQFLLQTAFMHAPRVIIGLTKENMYQHKILANQIETYSQRKQNILKYLKSINQLKNTKIIPLTDTFGPALTDPLIDVLVVSRQTLPGARLLNLTRQRQGLAPLPVITAQMINDDTGKYLSSTAIRQGRISNSGASYIKSLQHGLILTPALRAYFHRVHGRLYPALPVTQICKSHHSSLPLIAVGDQVCHDGVREHLPLTHLVYDSHIERRPVSPSFRHYFPYPLLTTANQPGHLTPQSIHAVRRLLALKAGYLAVAGEEDLLAVPLLLLAPLGSLILYGQPQQGVVLLNVTTARKQALVDQLQKSRT